MKIKDLLQLRSFFTIKEHTPGNLVIAVNPRILGFPHLKELKELAREHKGKDLGKVRFNLFTMSLGIEYDTARIDSAVLDSFLTNPDDAQVLDEAVAFASTLGITVDPEQEFGA